MFESRGPFKNALSINRTQIVGPKLSHPHVRQRISATITKNILSFFSVSCYNKILYLYDAITTFGSIYVGLMKFWVIQDKAL